MDDWIDNTAVSIDCIHVTCVLHDACLTLCCFEQCPRYKRTQDVPTENQGDGEHILQQPKA